MASADDSPGRHRSGGAAGLRRRLVEPPQRFSESGELACGGIAVQIKGAAGEGEVDALTGEALHDPQIHGLLGVEGGGVVAGVDVIDELQVQAGIAEFREMAAVEAGIGNGIDDLLHPGGDGLHLVHAGGVSDAEGIDHPPRVHVGEIQHRAVGES